MTEKIARIDLPATSRAYDIVVGEGILNLSGKLIRERLGSRRCVIITDSNVGPIYGNNITNSVEKAGLQVLAAITVNAGEASKDFATLQKTIESVLASGADRRTLVIALGGGVVGDLAGCVASLCLRGLDLVQIPTSLLAQVDSSVGGKNGINSAHGKNTVGAFYQPRLVIIDPATLNTLFDRHVVAGYAELVKYGLIRDKTFFEWCEKNGADLINGNTEARIYAIGKSCEHKAQVVMSDELESGERALLNLGHTFAHALEASTDYNDDVLLHGEAVALGIIMAFRLSTMLGLCDENEATMVERHIRSVGLPYKLPALKYDIDKLMTLMSQDKKAEAGTLTLILAHRIGDAFVERIIDPEMVKKLWQQQIGARSNA